MRTLHSSFQLDELKYGQVLRVHTKNTPYEIYRNKTLNEWPWLIVGHPNFCPEPLSSRILGSSKSQWDDLIAAERLGGRLGRLDVGYHMHFQTLVHGVTIHTSPIVTIEVVESKDL